MKTIKILLSFSAFCSLMVLIRNFRWGTGLHVVLADASATFSGATFLFLIWNLMLAWIPYGLSLLLGQLESQKSTLLLGIPIFLLWLIFLPNAPYILTDFIHLRARPPIPVWFDLIVLFSFALTGILLGVFSMLNVEQFIQKQFGKEIKRVFPALIIPLCAMGVYVGRFLRWNSWEIFSNPRLLIVEFWDLLQSIQFYQDLGIFILPFSILLWMIYWSVQSISITPSKNYQSS